jgi:hypothetical protein
MKTSSTATAVEPPATASVKPAADVGSTTTAAVTAMLRKRWIGRDRQSRESSKSNEGFEKTESVHNLTSRAT